MHNAFNALSYLVTDDSAAVLAAVGPDVQRLEHVGAARGS
jgi:hypothetical protein